MTQSYNRFQSLDPAPLGGASKQLTSEGKNIYEHGFQSANIPPCAACHGSGPRATAASHGLPDSSTIMDPTAQILTSHPIDAIAAYVSQMK